MRLHWVLQQSDLDVLFVEVSFCLHANAYCEGGSLRCISWLGVRYCLVVYLFRKMRSYDHVII